MSGYQKILIVFLRISIGWLFFYAGITKVLNLEWTALGYLKGAKAFTGFYGTLSNPQFLPVVNFLNEWGLTLIGVALILGIFTRLAGMFGALIMILYYLPLGFPYPNNHSLIVDEHIIYALVLLLLGALQSGRVWGLENWCSKLPICSKYPKIRNWLG